MGTDPIRTRTGKVLDRHKVLVDDPVHHERKNIHPSARSLHLGRESVSPQRATPDRKRDPFASREEMLSPYEESVAPQRARQSPQEESLFRRWETVPGVAQSDPRKGNRYFAVGNGSPV